MLDELLPPKRIVEIFQNECIPTHWRARPSPWVHARTPRPSCIGGWCQGSRSAHGAARRLSDRHDLARLSCACSAWPAARSVHQQVDGAESDREELLYGEFVESVAAVAAYRKVNPYIPFYQRLEKFLADDLLPAISLQANSRAHIHATVKAEPMLTSVDGANRWRA